jgi:Ceramidase
MKTKKEKAGYGFLIIMAVIAVAGIFLKEPIPQDPAYHHFKDVRNIMDIPNFWNVVSNIPFLIVGAIGLFKLSIKDKLKILPENKISYVLFYLSIFLVAVGSSYYHLYPNNETLVWDRLPMTIAFMALFSIVISEFISVQKGKTLLIPFILAGLIAVLYWHYSELAGNGNLTYYALVQFYPMVAIPLILICFSSRFTKGNAYWWLLSAYIAAKLCEHFDGEIYHVLHFISGHSIKHIIAALGLYAVLISYEKRGLKIKAKIQ